MTGAQLSDLSSLMGGRFDTVQQTAAGGPSAAARLFDAAAVKAVLSECPVPGTCFALLRDNRKLPVDRFTRPIHIGSRTAGSLMDVRLVLAAMREGCTLLLAGLQNYWPEVREVCHQLGARAGFEVQAFGVVTPAGARGFEPHRDDTDVVAVQCQGVKVWIVDLNTALAGSVIKPVEIELQPGDMLSLPAGTPHATRPPPATTAHITFTLHRDRKAL
jgi:hypothetical protein